MNNAERNLKGFSNSLRKKGLRVYGLLGNFSNVVEVSGKSGWYYVRIQQAGSNRYSLGEFQGNVRPLYNLPVVIEQDPITGEQYIVGTDQTLLQYGIDGGNEEPAPSELPLHANYHGWGGDDQIDWIHPSQIFPLRVQPSATAKHVIVQGGLAPLDGGWVAVSASIDVDLTSYWPVTGTSYVLLYLSTATTVTVSVCGTNLASVGNPPPGKCALAAVRLSAVLTSVSWTDIVDMRFLDNLAFVEELGTEEMGTNTVLQPDGAGAIAWTDKMELGAADLATDFPRAQTVIAQADSGHTYDQNIGIVGEAVADATYNAVGIGGVAKVVGAKQARGVVGRGVVDASADTGECVGVQGLCNATHAGGVNIGVLGTATNGANNFSFYGQSGKIYNADDIQLAAGKTVDGVDISAHAADVSAHHTRYTDAEALAAIPDASETVTGIVELATDTEAQAGTATGVVLTPANLRADIPATPAASRGVRLDVSGNLVMPSGGKIFIGASTDALLRIRGSATNTTPLANIGSGLAAYDAEKSSGYLIGVGMQPNVNATGDMSFVYGGYMFAGVTVASGKTVTKVAGMYVESADVSGSGAVTTLYGLYINSQSGAGTNYGLYQSGSNPNYFGGTVSIGTATTTNSKLTIESGVALKDGVSAPATSAGYAQIYVDTADGDLKVKFGDGTVKVLAADT